MNELELKFQVPAEAQKALRRELLARGARSTRLIARYFDTPDDLLAKHRVALRLRKEGRRWVQTLKASGASVVDRLEHNVPLQVPAGTDPQLDLSRHVGTPAGKALQDALGSTSPDALVERYATDVLRLAAQFKWPGSEVEAALDIGCLRSGDLERPICELELEHLAGGLDGLFELARLWRDHAGLWLDSRSKSQRGSVMATRQMYGPPVKARTPVLAVNMSGHVLLRAIVNSALEQILDNASELAGGSVDAEHVHQLRVGLRRMRSALRDLGALAHDIDSAWEPALAQIFGRLGGIRDDETVASAVRGLLQQAGAPKLAWPIESADKDAGAMVREAQFQQVLLQMLQWAVMPSSDEARSACPPEQAREHLEARLNKLHKQVVHGGKAFEQLPTEEQHRVRKRLKRLRYLAEFVRSLWPAKPVQRYLKRLEPAQDALGHHNDVVVAGEKFIADAQQDPASNFAAGFLVAHRAITARGACVALADVSKASRFWRR